MMTQTQALEAYRVVRSFQWDGWLLAPGGRCRCSCRQDPSSGCQGYVAEGCRCKESTCHCDCGISPSQYGGDVWLVAPGNPRKQMMLDHRFAIGDASLPAMSELLGQEEYQRLLRPWNKDSQYPPRRRARG